MAEEELRHAASQKGNHPVPLFPDLAACDIRFMQFLFHLSGGIDFADSFWRERGLDSKGERLVLGEYARQKVTHTVFIRWSRSHDECADIEFGMSVGRSATLYPERGQKHRLLGQAEFRDFFDTVRTMEVPGGIRSRFGYPFQLPGFNYSPAPSVRFTRISLEIIDKEERRVLDVDHVFYRKEWLMVLEPAGRRQFLQEPVSDKFFKAPYETACALSASIGGRES